MYRPPKNLTGLYRVIPAYTDLSPKNNFCDKFQWDTLSNLGQSSKVKMVKVIFFLLLRLLLFLLFKFALPMLALSINGINLHGYNPFEAWRSTDSSKRTIEHIQLWYKSWNVPHLALSHCQLRGRLQLKGISKVVFLSMPQAHLFIPHTMQLLVSPIPILTL
jgi:hypothetical protein